jgi:putative hydrolase of HD superfamily
VNHAVPQSFSPSPRQVTPTAETSGTPGAPPGSLHATAEAVVSLGRVALAFGRVNRVTLHEDGITPESDTDHTVMLGLIACALAQLWFPHLDPGLVAQFALVHDLVEVYAGDTPTITIDAAGAAAKQRREADAAQRLEDEFADSLPWIPRLIFDYERRAAPEARFVKAVDKLLPKITHLLNGGAALTGQGITRAELDDSWARQALAVTGYASDFPELLDLRAELVQRVAATYPDHDPTSAPTGAHL